MKGKIIVVCVKPPKPVRMVLSAVCHRKKKSISPGIF